MGGAEKAGGLRLAWPGAVSGRDWLGGRGRAGPEPLKGVGGRLSVSGGCGGGGRRRAGEVG